jgi:hypothetical protein
VEHTNEGEERRAHLQIANRIFQRLGTEYNLAQVRRASTQRSVDAIKQSQSGIQSPEYEKTLSRYRSPAAADD